MSRFFDVLKQANLSGLTSREIPVNGRVEHRRVNNSSTTTEVIAPPVSAPTAMASTTATDPWDLAPESHRGRDAIQANAFTPLARAAVDQNVRMIPNAVDRSVVEHYRRLRTKIMQQHALNSFRSLLVTSASPQEGKSVTVLNLALSFAMLSSFKVLVVDGDLRRNTLGKWLGAGERPGFSNLLDGSASLNEVVFACEDSAVHFIAGGTSTLPPAELLHSSQLAGQIRDLTSHFDLVLFDSPPLTLITDAHLLAAQTEAVLLVARAFKTRKKLLEQAVQDLTPFRVIGTVMNSGPRAHLYNGYGGYY
jgi:capsular exopolysaccharide synthesis family protein